MKRLVIAFAVLVAACGSASTADLPDAVGSLALERCDQADEAEGAEERAAEFPPLALPGLFAFCGTLETTAGVPLSVAVVGDRDRDPLAGRRVLVYHPGGPGISTVETLVGDPPGVDYSRFAVLAWDGVTASHITADCGEAGAVFGSADARTTGDAARRVADGCLDASADESLRGAWGAAAELEVLRRELGVEQFDLLTHSYGTAVAEAYLQLWPQHVGRAVLDGPIALEVGWSDRLSAVGGALDAVLDAVVAACELPECGPGDAGAAYEDLRAGLAAAAPFVGMSQLRVNGTAIDQAALLAMRSEQYWPALEEALTMAFAGDGMALLAMSDRYYFGLDRGVFYRSLCSDIDHPSGLEAYEVSGSSLLATYASELAPCAFIPRTEQPNFAEPATAGTPDVLIVASPYDVLTPAGLLQHAPRLQAIAQVCATDVVGHTSFAAEPVRQIVNEFLADGDAAAAAVRCGAETVQ